MSLSLLSCASTKKELSTTAHTFYVSSTRGDDHNSGTHEEPFRTIQTAQAHVRETIEPGMRDDVVVMIEGGNYYLDSPLHFDEKDSGRDGYQVIYRGRIGDEVNIFGGQHVTGWQKVRDGVYRAYVGKEGLYDVLAENGQRSNPARIPNTGYFRVGKGEVSDRRTNLSFNAEDIPESFDYREVRVSVWSGTHQPYDAGYNYNWVMDLLKIKNIDWNTRTITLDAPTTYDMRWNNRYLIEGAPEFIDQPGEWFLDRSEGFLYYWPVTEPIDQQAIVISNVDSVILLKGSSRSARVENLVFERLNLAVCSGRSYQGLVHTENCRNIVVRNCRMTAGGANGVSLIGASERVTVADCRIAYCGLNAVNIAGPDYSDTSYRDEVDAYVNKHHVITNNHLTHCGQTIRNSSGLVIKQSGDNEISNNLIERMPGSGIVIWGWPFGLMVAKTEQTDWARLEGIAYGKAITWENHWDFQLARNNHIVRNEIRNVLEDRQDAGAIYIFGIGPDNVVENNYVHDVTSAIGDGVSAGIYLDDAAYRVTIKDNLITNVGGTMMSFAMIIKGMENVIVNNILADNSIPNNTMSASYFIMQTPAVFESVPVEEKVSDLVFRNNIIYQKSGDLVYWITPLREDMIAECDRNIIWHPDGKYRCKLDNTVVEFDEWARKFECKYEQNTQMTDPLFNDPCRGDYTLQAESPALKTGFIPFDLSRVGLQDAQISSPERDGCFSRPGRR